MLVRVKAIAGWLHLWVGLITGIVVFTVSITGALLVFDKELFAIIHPRLVHVTPAGRPLPLSTLIQNARQALGPGKRLGNTFIGQANESYAFTSIKVHKKNQRGLTYFSRFKHFNKVYINQYTGQVLGVLDMRYEFFNVTERIHRQLLLETPDGSLIIGACVLLYVGMLITGFILWWPKNRAQAKQHFRIKWKARFKRLNYDLHNTLGFYTLPVIMLIALTGLTWSYKWFENGVYTLLGGKNVFAAQRHAPALPPAYNTRYAIDSVLPDVSRRLNNQFESISFSLPDDDENEITLFISGLHSTDGWHNVSYYFYDKRTGRPFSAMPHTSKPLGAKWRNSNKDIHTGRIYSWPTQVLALAASLVSASLPVTGFLIWWGKRKKKKKKPTRR